MNDAPQLVESVPRPEPGTTRALRSDLAKLCFEDREPDENRRLAYTNSICVVFLTLAIVGMKTPILTIATPRPPVDTVPVVFQPPPPEPAPPAPAAEPLEAAPETVTDTPAIPPVVAVESPQIAFAVPVEGPVLLTPAKFAPPPPPVSRPVVAKPAPAPQPVEFQRGVADGGFYPEPLYPRTALQRRMEGRVLLYVLVDEAGAPLEVQVRDSSGYALLDRHAQEWVQEKWRWPAGSTRYFLVPFRFQITRN